MASRFWVTTAGATWDGTTTANWATTSGGAGGASVPTAADDVFIDGLSGAGTVTLSAASVARSINCTGFTGTLSHPAAITFAIGDATAGASNVALKFVSGMTYTVGSQSTSIVSFISTSATQQTVDFGGKTIGQPQWTTAGNWLLTSASTVSGAFTHTAGTLDVGSFTHAWGSFAGNSSTARTMNFNASTISVSSGTSAWNWNTITNLTFNCGTSTINSLTANATIALGNLTYYNMIINGVTTTYSGNATFNNVTCQPAAGAGALMVLTGNWTINGLLTLVCSDSGTNSGRGWMTTSTVPNGAATRTITLTQAPVLQNFDFTDMAFSGTGAPYSGTALGDGLGNSGLTFPASRTLYWVGTAGSWSTLNRWALSSGGTTGGNGMPRAHDDVVFDANSAITSGTMNTNRTIGRNINMSAASNAINWSNGLSPTVIFGNLSLKAGSSLSGTGQFAFVGRGSQTLTTNGVSFNTVSVSFQAGTAGTYQLQDDLSLANSITFASGGLDFNNHNVLTTVFQSTQTNIRSWTMGSGTLTVNGTGTVFTVSDVNLTLSPGTCTIVVTDTSATAKTVNLPNAKSIYALTLPASAGAITVQWAGAATGHFGTISQAFNVTAPTSVVFSSGQTTTFGGQFNVNGTAGNLVTFTSGTPGTAYTFSKASGVVNSDYLSLTDSTATGGAGWYAGLHSTNVSNNTGWSFYPPVYVQRTSVQYTAVTTATITLPTPIDTSKSFIRTYQAVSGQTAPQVYQSEVYFTSLGTSVSSITCKRYTGTGTPTVYVEVISMHNLKVQHLNNIAFLSTDTSLNQTITAIGGTNKAFALTNGIANTATTSSAHLGFFRANISSTTNVAVTRGGSGSIGEAAVQVVEFTDGTTVEHQTVTANATSNATTLTNAIDPTKHFVFHNFSASTGVLDVYPQVYLSGTNTLNVSRGATTGTVTAEAYVVNITGTSVEVDTGADLAAVSNPITVANVTDTTRAFTIPSWTNTGTGSSWASQVGEAIMISTTEVDLNIFAAGNTTPYALQTIQLPVVFNKTSPAITKTLQYAVKKTPAGIAKSLQYNTPAIYNVIQNGSATDASSYTTASVTIAANSLQLFTVVSRTGTSVNPTQPTVTGAGLTWVAINSVVFDDTSASRRRITLFRAMGSGSGTLTIDFGGQTQTSADWVLDAAPNVRSGGTNGSAAIVQNVTNLDDTGTASSLTATLATVTAGSWTYAAWGYGNPGNAATAGTGYTKLSEFTEGEAGSAVITEWSSTGAAAAALSVAAGGELGVIAVEIGLPGGKATNSITQSLTYAIKKTPAAITKTLQYLTRAHPVISKSLKYTVKKPAGVDFSLNLDGVSNQGSFNIPNVPTTTTPITISVRFRLGLDGTNTPSSQPLMSYKYWRLYVRNGNQTRIRFDETVAHEAVDLTGITTGDFTNWYHFVGVYIPTGGTNNTMKAYHNGTLTQTNNLTALPVTDYSAGTNIGYLGTTGGTFFTGGIDQLKIYHGTPSDTDVANLYSSNTDFMTPEHVFNFVAGSGTTENNYGNANAPMTLSSSSMWAVPAVFGAAQKSLQYAIRLSRTALTQSLKYTVKRTPVALTKTIAYAVRKTITSLTRSLKYTVKNRGVLLTKTLTYDVRRTPAAISKSLRYAIRKPGAALSKSLQYVTKRSNVITLPARYVLDLPPLPDENLTYLRQSPRTDVVLDSESEITVLRNK